MPEAQAAPADPFELAYNELAQEILAHNEQMQRGRTMPEMAQAFRQPSTQFASSANTGLGDAIAQALGSPAAGRFVTGAQQAAKGVVDTAYGMTGIPMAADAGENMGRAVEEGNPLKGLMAAGEMGLAAVPVAGKVGRALYSTIPRAMATGAAYGIVPGLASGAIWPDSADAAEPAKPEGASPSNIQSLYSQREELMRQRSEAVQRREAEAKTGRGPNYQKADSDVNKVDAQLGGLTQMIANEERKSSPEYQIEVQKKQAEADEAERLKRANTSVKDLYPWMGPLITPLAMAAAGAAGAFTKGRYADAFNEKVGDLSTRWKTALDKANRSPLGSVERTQAVSEAKGLGKEFNAAKNSWTGGSIPAFLAGAGIGELSQLGPIAVDYSRATPGSDLYHKTVDTMSNPYEVGGRIFNGVMLGGVPAEVAAVLTGAAKKQAFPGYDARTQATKPGPPRSGGSPPKGPPPPPSSPSPPAGGLPSTSGPPPEAGPTPTTEAPPSTSSTSKSTAPSSPSEKNLPPGVKKSGAGYHGPDGRFLPYSIFKGKTSAADNPLRDLIG